MILDEIIEICKLYHGRVYQLEGEKWDLERGVKIKILEVPGPKNNSFCYMNMVFST